MILIHTCTGLPRSFDYIYLYLPESLLTSIIKREKLQIQNHLLALVFHLLVRTEDLLVILHRLLVQSVSLLAERKIYPSILSII